MMYRVIITDESWITLKEQVVEGRYADAERIAIKLRLECNGTHYLIKNVK